MKSSNQKNQESQNHLKSSSLGKRKFGKGKKAQFFIFTALVLIAFSTLLISSNNVIPASSRNFKIVYENYAYESNKAVNNAIFEGKDLSKEYARFTDRFITYAAQKKLGLEIIAVIAEGENYHFINRMNHPVTITNIGQVISPGSDTYYLRNTTELIIRVPDDVFHENIYKFNFPDTETEVKAVLRVSNGRSTEIFVKE